MANKTFSNVQLFEEFLTVLQNTDGTRRRTLDGVEVDLMANLDPSGRTNLAIELAKIDKWYQALFNYTAPLDPTTADGTVVIREEVLPDAVKHVQEGYYNNGAFYEESTHTTLMTPIDNAIYIDDHTDTLYIYDVTDPLDKHYKALDTDTTYAFSSTTDGTLTITPSVGSAQNLKIQNVEMVNHGYYGDTTHFYSDSAKTQAITLKIDTLYIDTPTDKVYFYNGTVLTPISSDSVKYRVVPVESSTGSGTSITDRFKLQITTSTASPIPEQDWSDTTWNSAVNLGLFTYSTTQGDPDYGLKIKSELLPSYVDDVVEGYYHDGAFYEDIQYQTEIPGEPDKIYVDLMTNHSYRYAPLSDTFIDISNPLDAEAICELLGIPVNTTPENVGDFKGVDTTKYTKITAGVAPADWPTTATPSTKYFKNTGTEAEPTYVGVTVADTYAADTYYVIGADGQHGLVPEPKAMNSDQNHYLKGDGTWSSPIDDINTLILHANNTPTIS